MTLYVDPPEGWRHGFPKAVPKDREADLLEWIVEQGYPKDLVFDGTGTIRLAIRCWREGGTHMSDELTLKAISTYNGNLHNGLTTALEAVVAMVLEEAARKVPTTWLDPLLTGPGATELPLDEPGVEKLCRGIAAAIRALKDKP